ncbi:NAD(P)H-dependent oxidoreductase [Pragia fontium]|uniref:NADPH:quinone oxidoreductase MdaB n=2 Tax=Pragia fontium TaxID=82985 RepID=A0AAJ4WD05_9GAMM|nr:NAD(P)H-dependent oxidoreductase [Pragia fontium]AKJ43465.1 NADPH quinone reductase MdaB [Pragia fontium]SFD29704.1 modulator of drug activity B [Pragia fontium DSM 5563 = ATCC 49100]SUB83948.1 Modulator of drug activity B [Pragia fontium]VEJ56847.1 Modulator of drug activity B [Pragia fontium]GKX64478.1 NADPH quinone reductase MdaB [Pragia fontium]
MSNILIINAMKKYAHSNGELNLTLHHAAADFLVQAGHQVQETIIDHGYNIEEEIEKYLWADTVIYQQPGWWMGTPWILKKYIDDVFTEGHGRLYASDGRTRSDGAKKYGSGGLIQGKTYMLSVTWNAPQEAFDDPEQFFEGAGVDGVYLPFHKANQFLGMTPLPTFLCTDVMKRPDVENNLKRLHQHLTEVFA